jgi:hypothetical protein
VRINLYSRGRDVDGLIDRCRQLGVADVGYACAHMPGFVETGVPDRERLRQDVGRLSRAATTAPASAPACT